MSLDRDTLKLAAVAVLDALAETHAKGHQSRKVRRYVLAAPGGTPLEIMFEQDEGSSANLWAHAAAAGALAGKGEPSPASELWMETGKDGKPKYGRHSALKTLPQLREADLIRFPLSTLEELGAVLDQLWAASAARVAI